MNAAKTCQFFGFRSHHFSPSSLRIIKVAFYEPSFDEDENDESEATIHPPRCRRWRADPAHAEPALAFQTIVVHMTIDLAAILRT